MEEKDISENAFNLIFAFDEIVALGYRESVTLSQIKTYVEMDSHEEKVYLAVRQTQEREAKQKMREKAKELQRQRLEASKRGVSLGRGSGQSYSGGSSSSFTGISSSSAVSTPATINEPAPSPIMYVTKLFDKNASADTIMILFLLLTGNRHQLEMH